MSGCLWFAYDQMLHVRSVLDRSQANAQQLLCCYAAARQLCMKNPTAWQLQGS